MFRSRLDDVGLVFCFDTEKRTGVHMWFVFFPIDVLFLDRKQKIVEMVALNPFSVYIPKKAAQYIVELPVGSKAKCAIGDRVRFKC